MILVNELEGKSARDFRERFSFLIKQTNKKNQKEVECVFLQENMVAGATAVIL